MNLTLKDIPEALHHRLREEADLSDLSLNKLILFTLEQTFGAQPADRTELLDRIRRRRETQTLWLDDAALALDDGRAGD
jgi:hypothetical protein